MRHMWTRSHAQVRNGINILFCSVFILHVLFYVIKQHIIKLSSGGIVSDSSGMRLHVTSNLRPNDIGNIQIGQNDIDIPGETDEILVSGTCPAKCTGLMLPKPIYITNVYLHMHGLGKLSLFHLFTEINCFWR